MRWVFGMPSGPVLPLIESLRKSSVQFILTASETSAGFMATTVGYLTGVPGRVRFDRRTRSDQSYYRRRLRVVGPRAGVAITCNVKSIMARAAHSDAHRSSCALQPLTKAAVYTREPAGVGEKLSKALAARDQRAAGTGASRFARR